MKRSALAFAFCVLGLAASASAQALTSSIVVNTGNQLNCSTVKGEAGFNAVSYQLSATAGSTATGVPKPTSLSLMINRYFDLCSEQLIQRFLSGTHIPKLTLTQNYSQIGSTTPFIPIIITLSDAMLTQYSIADSSQVSPTEVLSLSFAQVCITSNALPGRVVPSNVTRAAVTPPAITVCYNGPGNVVTDNK